MKKILLILLTITSLACSKKDNDNPCENLPTNGVEISTDLINTALAYLIDATSEACNEYKTAAEAYIQYSNAIIDCLEADDKAELKEEIQALKVEIAELNCS